MNYFARVDPGLLLNGLDLEPRSESLGLRGEPRFEGRLFDSLDVDLAEDRVLGEENWLEFIRHSADELAPPPVALRPDELGEVADVAERDADGLGLDTLSSEFVAVYHTDERPEGRLLGVFLDLHDFWTFTEFHDLPLFSLGDDAINEQLSAENDRNFFADQVHMRSSVMRLRHGGGILSSTANSPWRGLKLVICHSAAYNSNHGGNI